MMAEKETEQEMNRKEFIKAMAEVVGDAAKILPPKAFPGASVKSATKALEAFVTDRLAVK